MTFDISFLIDNWKKIGEDLANEINSSLREPTQSLTDYGRNELIILAKNLGYFDMKKRIEAVPASVDKVVEGWIGYIFKLRSKTGKGAPEGGPGTFIPPTKQKMLAKVESLYQPPIMKAINKVLRKSLGKEKVG